MADFCNKCAKEMWGEKSVPEIDVYKISDELCYGCIVEVMCEGCEMTGVLKDVRGNTFLLYPEMTREGPEVKRVALKDWEGKSALLISDTDNSGFIGGVQIGSPLGSYKLKIIKGIIEAPQKYHVIQEYPDKNKTQYSYLTGEEIIKKHSVDVKEKFEWIDKQKMFVP